MSRRWLVGGAVVAVAYIVSVLATVAFGPQHVRPLYDGFVPPSSYQWVDPPSFFASGNVTPRPVSRSLTLGPNGSEAAGVATPDGQFAIDIGAGAVAPRPGATSIEIRITPRAPRRLGAVPDGQRGDGNAYQVDMHYEPGDAPVTRLTRAGTLLVEIPEVGSRLYRSDDGSRWVSMPVRTVGARQLTLAGAFPGPGVYLAATNVPELVTTTTRSSRTGLVLGAVTAAVAAGLAGFSLVVVRRRRSVRPDESA